MLRKLVILAALLFVIPSIAFAQQGISLDLNSGRINWNWSPAPDSASIDRFQVRCGQLQSVYTNLTDTSPYMFSVALRDLNLTVGPWYCLVAAMNQAGEIRSVEMPFTVVEVIGPTPPSGVVSMTLK